MAKASLVGVLLAEGEEDLAALLARARLPEDLELERDAAVLAGIGLTAERLRTLLPPPVPDRTPVPQTGSRRGTAPPEQTISDRWAHLVAEWTRTPGAES